MILRRVIEHVKAQNWTAVALDFFIVVVGVFFGLQVNNWNEARADRSLGEEYVNRLIAELEQDIITTRDLANYYTAVLEGVKETDRLLADATADSRQLVVAAYRASEFATTPPNRATWDQIVSSGHLGLLPDGAIDGGVSEYYRYHESNSYTENLVQISQYRQTVRSIIPLSVQLAIREGCSDITNEYYIVSGFETECRLSVDQSAIDDTAEKLRANQNIAGELRHQYSTIAVVRDNNIGNIILAERALSALGRLEPAQ